MINCKIGIIGCGNMGEAILKGLSKVIEPSTSIYVSEYDEKRREVIQDKYKVIVSIDNNYIVKYSDVIILAVKPKDFAALLKSEVCCGVSEKKLIISIAAGITTQYIEKIVGREIPVIRAMPNMAAVIGESITSLSAGSSANKEHMKLASEIFSVIGDVVEIDESMVDAVTAISGSGPAYFFYLVESMLEAARELGLKDDIARRLVTKTALGSARLLESTKEDPALLRAKVTSKGGTTEAAFKVIEAAFVKRAMKEAVKKAHDRAKELAQ